MGQKKITDLQLRDNVSDTVNFPVDDGIQSYRVTAPQLWDYIRPLITSSVTVSAAGTDLDETNCVVLLNPTSASFTQNLPDCATLPVDFKLVLKNIATNGNYVDLDASGSQLIDNDLTLRLNSSPSMDGVTLINTTTKWLII
jgi:hypothetical protein